MKRLKRRTDFKAAAQAQRAPVDAFVLQARQRSDAADGPVRVGFTVSRQVGNAVKRNRARRRLREMVRLAPASALRPGHDYVVIGRRAAIDAPFGDMVRQFGAALRRVHAKPQTGQEPSRQPSRDDGAAPHRAGSPEGSPTKGSPKGLPTVRDRRAGRVSSHATTRERRKDTSKSG
ncbi:MAG: ribonuclease P protein component [Xanthobacteraceae bacterium]